MATLIRVLLVLVCWNGLQVNGQVSISPTDGIATAGQPHSLTCSVTLGEGASGTPVVEWRGPGGSQLDGDSDIMVGSVSMVNSSTFTSTLDFTTLRTSHGGEYTCQAIAGSLMGTATTSVIVQIPTLMVSVSHDGPSNNILPGGSSVTFTCNITVDPTVDTDVTVMAPWTSTGGRSGLSGSDPAVVQGAPVTTYQSSLTLDNLLTSDSGDYTCTASAIPSDPTFITSSAQQSDTVMITVELVVSISIDYTPPPDADLGPNEYRAASRLDITCEVQGATGTVSYTWVSTLGGGENDMTRQRSFLRSTHGGVQTCTATDSGGNSGSTSITVNVVGIGVQINVGDVDGDGVDDRTAAVPNNGLVFSLPVTSGNRFRIFCFSESTSTQNNVGEIIGLGGTSVTTDPFTVYDNNPGGIEISSTVDIGMDDQGVYTCRLPDSSNTQTLEANFGIYRSDFNTQPSVPTELTFDPIARTLTCISTGSPATTVTWRKNGVELDIDGSTYQLTQTVTDRRQATYENVLTINLDLQSIVGTYTCLVNNTLGSVSRDTNVIGIEIEAPPQPLIVGGMATIRCTTSLTVSSIQWLFSGEVVAEDTTEQQFLELTFDPVNDTIHERQYTCMLTLPGSLVFMESITINVAVPMPALNVSITAPGGTPEAGQEYTLTCTVNEIVEGLTNMPTLQWLDPMGSVIPSGSGDITVGGEVTDATSATLSLTFSTLRTSHGGNYTCQARLESPAVEGSIMETEEQNIVVQIKVRNLRATPNPTSIIVSWNEPETPNGIITAYEVYYQQQGEQERELRNVTDTSMTSTELTGLRPETTYTISVAAYTVAGRGESTVIESTTPPIAPVENVVVTTLNGTAVVVSWEPLMLPGWNVTYYTLYYSGLSVQQNRILEHFSQLFPGNTTSTVLVLVDSDSERMEHQLQVSASLEIEGEVYHGARSALTEDSKFIFDKAFFQIQFGPTEHCIGWNLEQARSIEEDLQRTIVAAISRQCNCSFPAEFLRSGTFSCRSLPTEVAYRSTTVGTDNYNATQLVRFIQNWVTSRPTMKIQWFIVDVYPDCPVRISSPSGPECSVSLPRDTDPTLITRDATVINCVRTCVRRLNGQRVCT